MKNKSLIITIVVAVIVGGAGFFGGMQYQKSQTPSFAMNREFGAGMGERRNMMIQGGPQGQAQAVRPVNGEIISTDDKSVTVKMQDGSTKIVILTDTTTVNKSSTGSKEDLKTGEKVTAFGSTNSDGSITAQMVSLGGTMMFRGGGVSGSTMPKQ